MIDKPTKGERVFSVFNIILNLLFAFLCLYPFYYMLIFALSDSAVSYKVIWHPVSMTLDNFRTVLSKEGFFSALRISVLRTVIGTTVTLLCCSFLGYLVTKKNMVGRKFIYRMLVATMYLEAGLVPTYLVIRAYGLINSFWVYIIPKAVMAYYVILIKTFIEQLPPALEESAMIDGAGPVRCWWSIVLPLSKPILATIAVFASVLQWNSWIDSHLYTTKSELWSLQYLLYRYLQEIQNISNAMEQLGDTMSQAIAMTPDVVRMTITALVTLPILAVYPFMQRYFIKGIQLGAEKE